jgi:hypothetical protein
MTVGVTLSGVPRSLATVIMYAFRGQPSRELAVRSPSAYPGEALGLTAGVRRVTSTGRRHQR